MDPTTLAELHEEIDDLRALIRNLELQLTWAKQTNRELRTQAARYEAVIGVAA